MRNTQPLGCLGPAFYFDVMNSRKQKQLKIKRGQKRSQTKNYCTHKQYKNKKGLCTHKNLLQDQKKENKNCGKRIDEHKKIDGIQERFLSESLNGSSKQNQVTTYLFTVKRGNSSPLDLCQNYIIFSFLFLYSPWVPTFFSVNKVVDKCSLFLCEKLSALIYFTVNTTVIIK